MTDAEGTETEYFIKDSLNETPCSELRAEMDVSNKELDSSNTTEETDERIDDTVPLSSCNENPSDLYITDLDHETHIYETASGTDDLSESKNKSSISPKQKKRNKVLKKKSKGKPMRKRRWRPLWKLTKKKLVKVQKRELRRIRRDRDALRAAGVALAPHNTSEFLIEDRGISSPDETNQDDHYQLNLTFNKEFEEEYESSYVNLYDKMTKYELVDRWIEAEDQIEVFEKQINNVRERKKLLGLSGIDAESEMAKIEVFKNEIEKLLEENEELYHKNARLEKYLACA